MVAERVELKGSKTLGLNGPKMQTEAALAWFVALAFGFLALSPKKTPAAVLHFVPPIGTYVYFKPDLSLRLRVTCG